MASDVEQMLPKLISAVEAMMNPATPQEQRLIAHQACEDFKENSPICAQCGAKMALRDQPHIIRHFGLQLLEYCVKYRWYKLSADDKVFIKEHTMQLVATQTYDILTEQLHIKDVLSRIIVEMIKREWPQQWPTLMVELDAVCKHGATQAEVVLLTFLRLAEDVIAFQTLPSQRRRDVLNSLTSHMSEIFTFLLTMLKDNVKLYKELIVSKDDSQLKQAQVHCRLAQAVLSTFTGYVDWVAMSHITDNNGMLLEMLCLMLSDDHLQLHASEVLLLITSRKGKIEDRKPLMVLFTHEAMSTILSAAVAASTSGVSEYHYLFLKRLCQVLTSIGSQLCSLWNPEGGIEQPPNFATYLEAIIAFTQHPSQILGSYCQILWASFLRHTFIREDPVFQKTLPRVIEACKTSLFKVGYPSQSNCRSCEYSRMDFDSDEDFSNFFSKYRAETAETVRLATVVSPLVTFNFVSAWLQALLQKQIHSEELCTMSSPVFHEWDALTVFLECVIPRLTISERPGPPVQEGIMLLKAVLAYETQDPLILSCLFSCISALFPYINDAPDTLPIVLDKIFSVAVFNIPGQTKATRSRAVKNVRRHACSCLVKMSKQYPHLLLPGFDTLYSHIKTLSSDPEELSQMEKTTLIEALILISNAFKNYKQQCDFIQEIIEPVKQMWLSGELKTALWSADEFLAYVGVDRAPVEPSDADTCGINRSHITYCVVFILAVMKRTTWPSSLEDAQAGNFIKQYEGSQTHIYRNPCLPHISPLLGNVLALLRTLNQLWTPENLAKRHLAFSKSFDLIASERLTILGIPAPCVDNTSPSAMKDPVDRMQKFFTSIYDNCHHILGNAGQSLGYDFYAAPNLAQHLLQTVFTNLEHLPDYRLRLHVRTSLKPYIQFCPKELYPVSVLPILAFLGPYMLQRLTEKWQLINQRCEQRADDDCDNTESEEVLEEHITRLLSREYIDLLFAIFINRRGSSAVANSDGAEEMMVEDENAAPQQRDVSLNDLGQLVVKTEDVFPSLITCLFTGLTWNDTSACNRCTLICWPLLKQVVADKKLGADDACHLFTAVLLGLQQHGQHEANLANLLTLAVQSYELLKPQFPEVSNILLQVPNVSANHIKTLDDKLFGNANQKPLPDRKKKESFKRVIQDIIGENIGQKFKHKAAIKNLPPMMRRSKPKPPSVDEAESKDIGLCALFTDN